MLDLPQVKEGQNVRVVQKITEGKRERSVPFVGRILKVKGVGSNMMITVRQVLEGVEVDRIFPMASPTISDIKIIEEKKSTALKTPRKTTRKKKK